MGYLVSQLYTGHLSTRISLSLHYLELQVTCALSTLTLCMKISAAQKNTVQSDTAWLLTIENTKPCKKKVVGAADLVP